MADTADTLHAGLTKPRPAGRTYLRDGTDAEGDVITDGVASMVPGISERDASGTRVLHLDQLGTARLRTYASRYVTNQFSSDAFAADRDDQSDPESGL